jgi:hypothetical protein
MVLRDNVTIRSLGKQVLDLLTEPNRIGQYMPGVVKIRIIELNRKYAFATRYREELNRKSWSIDNLHTFSGVVDAETPEETSLTIGSEWVNNARKPELFSAAREAVLHPINH